MKRQDNFTEGAIFAPLLRFALPVLAAIFLQTMYGAVDLLIVGQFGGALADVYVSAVSTGSQVMHTLTVVITGLAMGLTVFVGIKIGAGQKEEAGRIIGSGIVLFSALALVLTALMMGLAPQLAAAMHAPAAAFDETVSYILICSAGTFFIIAYNLVGSIFRGIGDAKMPLITVAIACVLNIAADLVLVAGLQMGASGAAIATVFAQAVSVALSLGIIRRRALPFDFSRSFIRADKGYIRRILFLGAPIALQDLLVSFSFLFIIAIVNALGLTESAGVGVAEKLCGFLMLVPSAFMQAMSAFVAQNIGARRPERAKRALLCGLAASFAAGSVMFYFTFFHGELLAAIFAKDLPIILAATEYLKAYGVDCLLTAFLFCFIGYCNGCGNTTFVMAQGIIGAFGVRLPVSWLMSRSEEVSLFRIGLATPASTLVQILLFLGFFLWQARRKKMGLEIALIVVGVLIALVGIVSMVVSGWLMFRYVKYNRMENSMGLSGQQIARKILDDNGLAHIKVKTTGSILFGNSYSHYFKKVRLRRMTRHEMSLTSMGMGAQKAALAILDKEGDPDMKKRIRLVPLITFGPFAFVPLILVGIALEYFVFNQSGTMVYVLGALGLLFYVNAVVLSFATLKTEKKAQERAYEILQADGVTEEELICLKDLFHLYNIQYINDIILSGLELLYTVLEIMIAIKKKDD